MSGQINKNLSHEKFTWIIKTLKVAYASRSQQHVPLSIYWSISKKSKLPYPKNSPLSAVKFLHHDTPMKGSYYQAPTLDWDNRLIVIPFSVFHLVVNFTRKKRVIISWNKKFKHYIFLLLNYFVGMEIHKKIFLKQQIKSNKIF